MSDGFRLDDDLSATPLEALDGLIDGRIGGSSHLPPLWHWVYFLERPPQSELGPDGHARVGRPTPPAPGLRRMFAGGRVTTHRLLEIGVPAQMRSDVVSSVEKDGRSGKLWFLTVRNTYTQRGREHIVDERDIVYRPAAPEGQPAAKPKPVEPADPSIAAAAGIDLPIDPTVLFRFSALTYNAHRIHYDLGWAAHEGYSGLVVHGPLQALMLGELARRDGQDLVGATFAYRLVSPFVDGRLLRARPTPDGAVVLNDQDVITARSTLAPA